MPSHADADGGATEEQDALIAELATLTTEQRAHAGHDLEGQDTLSLVLAMNDQDQLVPAAIRQHAHAIAQAVDAITDRLHRGGRLFYLGAGSAGRIGILDASECPPTFGTDPSLVVGLIAGGSAAIQSAVENAEDDDLAARTALQDRDLAQDDVVVGISASGRTPFVVAGLRYAREVGAFTVSIASNQNSAISQVAEVALDVVVGPEFVTGSTRLKAGTAQKLIVNMLSTLSMIKLGKTYQGVMVDLRATNKKLHARSVRTVVEVADVDARTASQTLDDVNGSVKQALLALLGDVATDHTHAALLEADGSLRRAIAMAKEG
ncbi:MAG: N-acetylmuramic acid 6-phosphate etherase [Beutenbergiaceae bacterium]